jgi:sodium transport system ATP-binding protein
VARSAEARRRLAYLSSSMGLYARLSAREVVAFFGQLHGLEGPVLAERVESVTRQFGLDDFADRLCGKLSTGQRQRVALARALVHDPPVMILDEPTLGLDVLSGQAIHQFIEREAGRGKSILFSTHQMEEVELLADRVGVLRRGELVAEGTPAEIVDRTGERNLARAFLALVAAEAPA